VIPKELVGIEIGSRSRQEVQLEPTLERLHVGGDNLSAMRRMAVEHEEDRPHPIAHESFELGDEHLGIKFAGINVIPKSTVGIDCRNGVDLLALTAGCDDGRLTFSAPGAL